MMWAVHYTSAGCLPDGDPPIFGSLKDAREYLATEWLAAWDDATDLCKHTDTVGEWSVPFAMNGHARLVDDLEHLLGDAISDPRIDSLYSWSIEEATE